MNEALSQKDASLHLAPTKTPTTKRGAKTQYNEVYPEQA